MERTDRATYLVDANLLVLLVVGLTSRPLISRHKKTKTFGLHDFDRLRDLLRDNPIVILPNVATETSNLLCFHGEPERTNLLDTFRLLLRNIEERCVSSNSAAARREYRYLGLTDAAILEMGGEVRILTTDALLFESALRSGLDAVNFNHAR